MAWLRLDDRFASHPKIGELSDREFRVHVRVLCYCALHGTAGLVRPAAFLEVPQLTRSISDKLVRIGLWEEDDGDLYVHDWKVYNPEDPSHADRQRRYRERRKRDGESDAARDVTSDTEVTGDVTDNGTPPARAGARGPSPTPRTENTATGSKPSEERQTVTVPLELTDEERAALEDLKPFVSVRTQQLDAIAQAPRKPDDDDIPF